MKSIIETFITTLLKYKGKKIKCSNCSRKTGEVIKYRLENYNVDILNTATVISDYIMSDKIYIDLINVLDIAHYEYPISIDFGLTYKDKYISITIYK